MTGIFTNILLCATLLLLALCCIKQSVEEAYENRFHKDIQVVIARYKEDLQFLKDGAFDDFDVLIYNKGDPIVDSALQQYKIVNLPNVGKIDHTILYHIIENYDRLHDTTLFLPASFMSSDPKRERMEEIMKKLNKNDSTDTALLPIGVGGPVRDVLYNFSMKGWTSTYGPNRNPLVDDKMQLSPIRPFGEWYRKVFGDKQVDQLFYFGLFAVSRDEIRKNPRSKYQEIISYVDSHPNPEAGHYIERSWVSLFS